MRFKIGLVFGMVAFLTLVCSGLALSQTEEVQSEVVVETPVEPEAQWLWGEVVSVDMQKNEILLSYIDLETDREKEIVINVDEKTIYENVASLTEIRPEDTLSIDYIVTPEGQNLATGISVEKGENEEVSQEENYPAEDILEEAEPAVTPSE